MGGGEDEGPRGEGDGDRVAQGKIAIDSCDCAYLVGEERAEVNDLPAAARDHVLAGRLREEPDGLEVHVEDLLGWEHRGGTLREPGSSENGGG